MTNELDGNSESSLISTDESPSAKDEHPVSCSSHDAPTRETELAPARQTGSSAADWLGGIGTLTCALFAALTYFTSLYSPRASVPEMPCQTNALLQDSPITFAEFAAVTADEARTELQKSSFHAIHRGRRVKWHGFVVEVNSITHNNRPELVMSPNRDPCDYVAVADVSGNTAKDLGNVKKGREIVLTGIIEEADVAKVLLADCRVQAVLDGCETEPASTQPEEG